MITKGVDRAPHRSLLRAAGLKKKISVNRSSRFVNSYIDIVPGHVHLQEFGKIVKEAIREAGGVPFEFNTIGVDDGIAMGHIGMRYSCQAVKSSQIPWKLLYRHIGLTVWCAFQTVTR